MSADSTSIDAEQMSGLTSRLKRIWDAGPYGWNRALTRPSVLIPFFLLVALLPFGTQYLTDTFGWTDGLYWLKIATLCAEYAALALALNLVVGYAGLLNLGFIAFFAIGSYTYAMVASDQLNQHFPLWWAVLTVVGVSVLFGLLLGVPSLRLRGDYLAIVTLGFGLIIREVVQNLDRPPVLMGHQFGPSNLNITGGTAGIQLVDELTLPKWFPLIHGMALQQRTYYWIFLGFLAVCVLCMLRWRNSRPGRAWIAIREDELAARAMGVNVFKYRLLAFTTSAAMAGLVGMIDAAYLHNAFPENFDVTQTILIFIMVVLGGLASIPGAIVGATIVIVIPYMLQQLIFYKYVVFSLVLILLMIFRPHGILGTVSLRPRRTLGGTLELFTEAETGPPTGVAPTLAGETPAELEATTGTIVDPSQEPQ